MKKINLGQKELIHFVGIGGIGMSGLAIIMKNMGFRIQGSDQNKNFSFLVEEKDLNDKLLNLLKEIYENMSKLDEIKSNQRQYSDKHVYENIHKVLDKILNEKN